MLSVTMLQRYFDATQFDRLVKGVASNGSPLPLPLVARLGYPAAGTALALRRLVELTYGPTSLSRQMTSLLLALQRTGGAFAGGEERCPLATAAAAAALGTILRDHGGDERVESAYEQAIAALASMQDSNGLFGGAGDRSLQDRASTSAFVFSVLADDDRFRETVRLADLQRWFDTHGTRLDRPTAELYRRATARQPVALTPAYAGIAA